MSHTIRTNCPRDCYDGCGILVTVKDGKRPKVAGDPAHPVSRGSLCSKCGVAYNGVFQDEEARLQTPLRRVGDKGAGEFEPISWDEALATIATKFNAIIEERGADSILTMTYSGTLSLLAYFFPSRWVNHLGAAEVDYGTICNTAGHVAWDLLFGTSSKGFDPRTAKDASCILVWGANPSHSAPHMHKHWLNDANAKVIVVDPIRTKTAAAADLHLQPRPGTDAALAFSMLHALSECDALDEDFIASHVVGFEEIAATIEECTPEWGESLTGVPAADIRLAAQLYSAGPSLLWCGQSLQRQPQGGNIMRAVGLLPTVTGNAGKPGAGFYYLNETPEFAGADYDYLTAASLRKKEVRTVGALDLAESLADREAFKAFIVWNTNPLASCSDQKRLREACARDDLFTVVIDLFETDTARYADIVLPAASFLEFDDITYSYFNLIMGAQSKVREPIGESLPNQEIFRRLAGAMDLDNAALFEDDPTIIGNILEQCGVEYDFAELQRRGYFSLNGDEPLIFFQDLKFDTPSGHIEIASERAEKMGIPRVPHPGIDQEPENDQLRLLTPASNWRMNDSYGNDERLQKRAGAAELIICAEDATSRNIQHGDVVRVSNEEGEIELVAQVEDIVRSGTVVSYKGRWPTRESAGNNVNCLHAGSKNDMGESTSVHGIMVTVIPT